MIENDHDCNKCLIAGKCSRHPTANKSGIFNAICRGDGSPIVRDKWMKIWDSGEGIVHPQPVIKRRGLGDVVAGIIDKVTFGKFKKCGGCKKRQEWLNQVVPFESPTMSQVTWSYGMTTVLPRINSGLTKITLDSLKKTGFDSPRLFVDGPMPKETFGLEVTARSQTVRAFGNWYLALLELYIRNPNSQRYAIFQDDFVTCLGLKDYLSSLSMPENGYWNLYTFPHNQPDQLAIRKQDGQPTHPELDPNQTGFYRSCQGGKGAVALVFSNEAVKVLLTQRHMIDRIQDPHRGHRSVDGGVVDSFKKAGWVEYVHNPSLVQHIGQHSSMGNPQHLQAVSFRGEGWDARTLIR